MKKFAFALVTVVAAATLTACGAVSAEERAACEESGGWVESKSFHYEGDGGFFDTDSGDLEFCEKDGKIAEVYTEEVTELDYGIFGDDDENRKVFHGCKELEGRVYKTERLVGKVNYTYFVCVHGGEVVQILK